MNNARPGGAGPRNPGQDRPAIAVLCTTTSSSQASRTASPTCCVSSMKPEQGEALHEPRPRHSRAMLAAVPSLRAFAISLCGNVDRADDLVQETLLRALANIDSFQPGTNMSAWLFTILRNLFRSEYRKRRREVEDADGSYAETLKSHPEQTSQRRIQGIPRRAGQAAGRPARGADPGRRVGLLLRGSGRDLRMRGRHHQEPRQPRAHAAGRTVADRERRRLRSRSATRAVLTGDDVA